VTQYLFTIKSKQLAVVLTVESRWLLLLRASHCLFYLSILFGGDTNRNQGLPANQLKRVQNHLLVLRAHAPNPCQVIVNLISAQDFAWSRVVMCRRSRNAIGRL
jgi:hypothetical protein